MFLGRDQNTLVVTDLDVTNPTYITFADCTRTGNWFPLFYFCCNHEIECSSLISIGSKFQITESKYLKKLLPLRTVFTEGIASSSLDRKLTLLSLFTNNSFKLFSEIS